uniref:Uncharacterized protein n=1 Tax=Monopterus albus TaxID=43700 RepID=A0A3Q3JRT6_MONAL
MASSPAPPPHILYNPTQHMLTYAGFCPGQTLPAYPNYPISMQVGAKTQKQHCTALAPTQPQCQGATQEPGGYMLTPNAPVLYGPTYPTFEKPPPYAC